jgi:hypothetical protein
MDFLADLLIYDMWRKQQQARQPVYVQAPTPPPPKPRPIPESARQEGFSYFHEGNVFYFHENKWRAISVATRGDMIDLPRAPAIPPWVPAIPTYEYAGRKHRRARGCAISIDSVSRNEYR